MNHGAMIYLGLLRHSWEWSHVMSHLLKIFLGIGAMIGIFVLVNWFARHAARSDQKRKHHHTGGVNRQQRRQERAMKRKRK